MAKDQPSRSCARSSKLANSAPTSIPRRISCISTSDFGWAAWEHANAGASITVFEITTAAAFLLFARHPADVLLLEVGLGGRLDATNVVERPLVTVVTPVSLDHAEFLGDTVTLIAAEKAGIFKRGAPAIVAAQPRDALAV